jgi:hypothetical protein
MNNLQKFSTEEDLATHIDIHTNEYTAAIQNAIGDDLIQRYSIAARKANIAARWYTAALFTGMPAIIYFVSLDEIDVSYFTYPSWVLPTVVVGICLTALFVHIGRRWGKNTHAILNEYENKLTDALYKTIFSIFDINGEYITHTFPKKAPGNSRNPLQLLSAFSTQQIINRNSEPSLSNGTESKAFLVPQSLRGILKSDQQKSVAALLVHSELITTTYHKMHLDDMFKVSLQGSELFVAELNLMEKKGSGKNQRLVSIFEGLFISFDIQKQLEGKTFVTTDKDTKGFGNGSNVEPTQLEWNDFEELLHVTTTNPVEARYVLTPNFMLDLYTWWNGKEGNIRLSFIQNRMYVLFPYTKLFGENSFEITEASVSTYLKQTCTPLFHILKLIGDTQKEHGH